MDPMLEAFIGETRENLETAGRCFLELEKQPGDDALMNDLFRAIHTIKGSSGLFDIPAFTKVVHAAEDVLDRARSGELELNAEGIDLFLETMDQISLWLDDLEASQQLSDDADELSLNLIQTLRKLLGDTDVAQTDLLDEGPNHTAEGEVSLCEAPDWVDQVPEPVRISLFQQEQEQEARIWGVEYAPDSQSFFSGEDPLHTMRNLPGLIWFQMQPRSPWPAVDELDPYHCNLVFQGIARAESAEIHHYLRYIPEQVEIVPFSRDFLVSPRGCHGNEEPYISFLQDAQQSIQTEDWDRLGQLISPLLQFSGPDLLQTSALRWMDTLIKQEVFHVGLLNALLEAMSSGVFKRPDFNFEEDMIPPTTKEITTNSMTEKSEQAPLSSKLNDIQIAAIKQVFKTQKHILTLSCSDELIAGRIASTAQILNNILSLDQKETTRLDLVVQEAQSQKTLAPLMNFLSEYSGEVPPHESPSEGTEPVPAASSPTAGMPAQNKRSGIDRRQGDRRQGDRRQGESLTETNQSSAAHTVIKVDQQRIDILMDLVGELVVAKNALPFLAKRAIDDFGVRELSKEIETNYAVINRLSEELQGAMMQIRMVPVSSVFQRFPRLVRDLSRKLDKQIKLVIEGEETEADKNVVDNLADPLIHLVRNSLDHGLESEAERKAAGKPPVGTITLRAIPHDDQVVIEIVDDGHGIDPEIIKHKAYEKGIIDEQRLDNITDKEALQLIFAAGLSTAKQISDLSGRGVGMDVVHSAIRNAGGSVFAESILGQGTTIRLALPLSMAVSHVMMIETDKQIYGVSMSEIVETVRIPGSSIQRIKQNEAVVLRNQLIPLFHLRTLLKLPSVDETPEEVAVLIMSLGGQLSGLVIDEFHEGIDIIQKPLEGVMANYPWYSGAALLGDGSVLLVLNTQELLSCR